MHPHRQGLLLDVPAPATPLGGVRGIDGHDQTVGSFSLPRQNGAEHPPGSIGNRLGEAVVLDHALDVEPLDGDDAVAVDQPSGGLVDEIVTPVPDALVNARDDSAGLAPLTASTLLFGKFPLSLRQNLLVTAEEARVVDVLAIGQRREGFQPNVNADLLIGRRQEFGDDLHGKAHEPLEVDSADGAGLDDALYRAVQTDGDIAYLGQPQSALVEPESALRVGDAVVLAFAFDSWVSRRLTRFDAAKEGVKGQINADGDVLQHLGVDPAEFGVFLLPSRERGLLLEPGRRLAQHFVVVLAPVQEAVVDLSAGFQRLRQGRLLRLRRIKAIPICELEGFSHSTSWAWVRNAAGSRCTASR